MSKNIKYGIYTYETFSGFYCSMDTSRIIRVGSRIYVIRIAAVSQDVPVCITRKITLAENDMVLVLTSKLTWLLGGWSKQTWFQCGGSELTWIQSRGRNWLGFVWGSKMAWLRVWVKLTWLLCRGIFIGLFLEWGLKLTWQCCVRHANKRSHSPPHLYPWTQHEPGASSIAAHPAR